MTSDRTYPGTTVEPRRPRDGLPCLLGGIYELPGADPAGGRWVGEAEVKRQESVFIEALAPLAGRGAILMFALPSGVELATAVSACLDLRIPFLLLDPDTGRDRLDLVARQVGPDLLVTRRADLLAGESVRAWCPGQPLPAVDRRANPGATTDDWAYGVVTSGSTGVPKVCVIGREALAGHCSRALDTFGLTADDVILQAAVPGFDVWLEEVIPTAVAGARLVMLPHGLRLGAAEFTDLLHRTGVTVVNLPASFWSLWLDWLLGQAPGPRGTTMPPTLRLVLTGSEAVSASTARRWVSTFGTRPRLLSAYGLSESTITNFVYDVSADGVPEDAALLPLGRPLPGCRYELGDAVASDASVRELVLTGTDVQLGYLEPWADDGQRAVRHSGGRLATGDLVRCVDGQLHFVGRRDDQLKVRGVRVSPIDIELTIRRRPDVEEAVVIGVPQPRGRKVLAAFVVGSGPGGVAVDELQADLAAVLPAGAVPDRILVVPEIPRMANGKVDRQRLGSELGSAGTAGVGGNAVQRIMAELLARDVDEDTDFFAAGGHSLLAVALLNRLESELGVGLRLSDIFAARTPRRLLARMSPARRPSMPPLRAGVLPPRIPLTAQQEVVWFHHMMEPESQAYHCQSLVEFAAEIDLDRLERVLQEIVRAHGIYRTSFHDEDGFGYQVVHPAADLVLDRVAAAPDSTATAVDRMVDEYVARPFDVATAPLIRAMAITREGAGPVLVIVDHHLVHDGYTFALLLRELCDRYNQVGRFEQPEFSYGHYAMWQAENLAQLEDDQLRYWQGRVESAGECRALSSERSGTALTRRVRIDQGVVDAARAATASRPVTLYHLFVAALGLVLSAAGGGTSFCLGAGMGNRRLPGADRILGMFINVLPVVVDIDTAAPLADYVGSCAREVIDGLDHQELPTTHLARRLPVRSPLYRATLGFDDGPVPDIRLGTVPGTLVELTNSYSKVPLNLTVILPREQRVGTSAGAPAHIDVLWELDELAASRETLDRLIPAFETALDLVSSDRPLTVSDVLVEIAEAMSGRAGLAR
jgi:non-ribosomal peptide synthetase component F